MLEVIKEQKLPSCAADVLENLVLLVIWKLYPYAGKNGRNRVFQWKKLTINHEYASALHRYMVQGLHIALPG